MSKNSKIPAGSATPSNLEKDPSDWTTGGETMTGAQASYLKTLCEEAGEPFEPPLANAARTESVTEWRRAPG